MARTAQELAEQGRARVARQLARLTAQMTVIMHRDLSRRLAQIEAKAQEAPGASDLEPGIAATGAERAEDPAPSPAVAEPAEVSGLPESAEIEPSASGPGAEIAATGPEQADEAAPSQAEVEMAEVSGLPGPAGIEPSASDLKEMPAKAQAPQPNRPKPKRPHDGVKPPFRGLKRLWRKARGRGVPRV